MQFIGEHGIVRSRDVEAIGFPRQYLVRLRRQGKLIGLHVESTHFQTPT
jgi:hypothetical protein